MRISPIVVTLITCCFLSRDAGGKPMEMGDTVTDVLTRALVGSDKEKTEALSLVLELLAQIDLPSLCQSIAAKATDFRRVDDIIARAATGYDGLTPSGTMAQRKTDRDSKDSLKETSQQVSNVSLDHDNPTNMANTVYTPYDGRDNKPFVKDTQTLSGSYDYLTKLQTLPQQYPDYNSLLLPNNHNYDFYDINDNLVYDVTGPAGDAPHYSDVIKTDTPAVDKKGKDGMPLFFPEDFMTFVSLSNVDEGSKKSFEEEVIIKDSKSLKPDSKLIAENLKMEELDGSRHLSDGSVRASSTTYGDESRKETASFWREKTNNKENTNTSTDKFDSNDTSNPSSIWNKTTVPSTAFTADMKTQTAGMDVGTQTAGTDVKTQTAGTDVKTQTAGMDVKTQTAGTDVKTQTAGTDVKTQTAGMDVKTQTAGMDVGTQTAGTDVGTQTAGTDVKTQTAGMDVGTQTAGMDVKTQTAGMDVKTQTAGMDVGTQTAGMDVKTQTAGMDVKTQTAGMDVGTQTAGMDVRTQTAGMDVKTQTAGMDVRTQTAGMDVKTQTAGMDVGTQTAGMDVRTQTAGMDVKTQTAGMDVGTQTAGMDVRTQTAGMDVKTQTAGMDVKTQTAGMDVKTQTAGMDVKTQTAGMDVKTQTAGMDVKTQTAGMDVKTQTAGMDVKTQTAPHVSMTSSRLTSSSSVTTRTTTSASTSTSTSNANTTSTSDDGPSHVVDDGDEAAMDKMDINAVKGNYSKPKSRVRAELFHSMNFDLQAANTDGDLLGYRTPTDTDGDLLGYLMPTDTDGDLLGYRMPTDTDGDLLGYRTPTDTDGDLLGYLMPTNTDGDLLGYRTPTNTDSSASQSQHINTSNSQTSVYVNTSMPGPSPHNLMSTVNEEGLGTVSDSFNKKKESEQATNTEQTVPPSLFNFTAGSPTEFDPHTEIEQLASEESTTLSRNDWEDTATATTVTSTRLYNTSALVANVSANLPTIGLGLNDTTPKSFVTQLDVTMHNHTKVPTELYMSETSVSEGKDDDLSAFTTDSQLSTTVNAFSVVTNRKTAQDVSQAATEDKDISNRSQEMAQNDTFLEQTTANTSMKSVEVRTDDETSNTLSEEAGFNRTSSGIPTGTLNSTMGGHLNTSTPTLSAMKRIVLSSDSTQDRANAAASLDLRTRTIPKETWTSQASEDSTAPTTSMGSVTAVLTSDSTADSSLANSSDILMQMFDSTYLAPQVTATESHSLQLKENVTESEDSDAEKATDDAHLKPERLWWRPSYYRSQHNMEQQNTVKQLKSTDGTEVEQSVFSREPFSLWAGRQMQDKWWQAKNSQASANRQTSGRYSHTGPSYSTYPLGVGKLMNDQHTSKDKYEETGNARNKSSTTNTTSISFTSGHQGEAETKPQVPHSRYYIPDNRRSYPTTWSTFSSHFPFPNLGTLWGINRDSRNILGVLKYNDLTAPPSPKYILPWLNKPKGDSGDESDQSEDSQEAKEDGTSVLDTAAQRLGLQQKTVWSETAASSRLQPRYKGYACPGLFGYFGDFMDCRSFFICSWGAPYRFYCPSGTLWNPTHSVCDWARNVACPN